MKKNNIFLIFVIMIFPIVIFAGPDFPQMPPGFRIGMEREIDKVALSKIIHFFDFSKIQSLTDRRLKTEFSLDDFDEYLELAPVKRLAEFPAALREKLTKGLKLENVLETKASSVITPANSTISSPRLILSSLSLENHEIKTPVVKNIEVKAEKNYDQAMRRAEWVKLSERWKALSFDEKIDVVKFENLRPIKKAEIAIKYGGNNITLPLKKDLPKEISDLFNKFSWDEQLDIMEFRHKNDVIINSPSKFFNDLEFFAKLTGTTKDIFEPEKTHFDQALLQQNLSQSRYQKISTLHYHLSIPNYEIQPIAQAFNDKLLFERINQGISNDITGVGIFLYKNSDLSARGLIKIINRERMEFRVHPKNILDELQFNLKAFSLPPNEGIDFVKKEIYGLMNNENLYKILVGNAEIFKKIMKNYPLEDKKSKEFLNFAMEKIRLAPNKQVGLKFFNRLEDAFSKSKEFKLLIANEIESHNTPLWLMKRLEFTNEDLIMGVKFETEKAFKLIDLLNKTEDPDELYLEINKLFSMQEEDVILGKKHSEFIDYLIKNSNLKTFNMIIENFTYQKGENWLKLLESKKFKDFAIDLFKKSSPLDQNMFLKNILEHCLRIATWHSCAMINVLVDVLDPSQFKEVSTKISQFGFYGIERKNELTFNMLKKINKNEYSSEWIEAKKSVLYNEYLNFTKKDILSDFFNPISIENEPSELIRAKLHHLRSTNSVDAYMILARYIDFPDFQVREDAMMLLSNNMYAKFADPSLNLYIKNKLKNYAKKKYSTNEKLNALLFKMNMNYKLDLKGFETGNLPLQSLHNVRKCGDYFSLLEQKFDGIKNKKMIGAGAIASTGTVVGALNYKEEVKEWLKNNNNQSNE